MKKSVVIPQKDSTNTRKVHVVLDKIVSVTEWYSNNDLEGLKYIYIKVIDGKEYVLEKDDAHTFMRAWQEYNIMG